MCMSPTEYAHTDPQKMENRFAVENKAITKFVGGEGGSERRRFEASKMLESSKNVDLLFAQTTQNVCGRP